MFIVRNRKLIVSLLAVLVVVACGVIGYFGLHQGIDFTGGAEMELAYTSGTRPANSVVEQKLAPLNLGNIHIQPVGDDSVIIRVRALSEGEHIEALTALGAAPQNEAVREEGYSSIGPSIGAELKRKAGFGIALVLLLIILYIAIAFRKVGRIVPGWLYGVITIVTLVHDILIPTAVFAVLGAYFGVEIDALFVTALLAIMGYSISDTIVVFDRIRENLAHASPKDQEQNFADIVGKSLNETIVRSINTSLTVIIATVTLVIVGSEATRYFALTLAIGAFAGSYSSILLASPLLVLLQGLRKNQ